MNLKAHKIFKDSISFFPPFHTSLVMFILVLSGSVSLQAFTVVSFGQLVVVRG
jgi:hypothetical protein